MITGAIILMPETLTGLSRSARKRRNLRPVGCKLLPVRFGGLTQGEAHQFTLTLILFIVQNAAHELKTQEHEVGIDHIGFAIVAYCNDLACLEGTPDLRTIHAQ